MATVDLPSLLKGRVGELVFRTYRGKLIAQGRPTRYRNRNSAAQQKQRGGMRNLIASPQQLHYNATMNSKSLLR